MLAEIGKLRSLVTTIENGSSLEPASPEFEAVMSQALEAVGPPHDIEEWAIQLANDIAGISD